MAVSCVPVHTQLLTSSALQAEWLQVFNALAASKSTIMLVRSALCKDLAAMQAAQKLLQDGTDFVQVLWAAACGQPQLNLSAPAENKNTDSKHTVCLSCGQTFAHVTTQSQAVVHTMHTNGCHSAMLSTQLCRTRWVTQHANLALLRLDCLKVYAEAAYITLA